MRIEKHDGAIVFHFKKYIGKIWMTYGAAMNIANQFDICEVFIIR